MKVPQVYRSLFVLVLLHTATANGFQMVTSGAQSKAIHDWLIPSVEVSSSSGQILTGDVDGMPSLWGSHQPFRLMGEVG